MRLRTVPDPSVPTASTPHDWQALTDGDRVKRNPAAPGAVRRVGQTRSTDQPPAHIHGTVLRRVRNGTGSERGKCD